MQKGAQALGLANLGRALKFSAWNENRRAKQIAAGVMPSKQDKSQQAPDDPPAWNDDMRIDSDDIHYHFQPNTQQGSSWSPVPSLIKTGLLAAAVAVPGYGLATQLPSIISAIKGVTAPSDQPATPSTPTDDPFLGLGVRVGDPKE